MKSGQLTSNGGPFAIVGHGKSWGNQNQNTVERDDGALPKDVDHTPHTVLSISITSFDKVFA